MEARSVSSEPVCSCAPLFAHFAHETAGAARTRSSLRPLFSRRGIERQASGATAREIAKLYPAVIACDKREAFAQGSEATKQSIRSPSGAMDCFAEPVIGRAYARPGVSQ